jgi:hypothetical protein
MKYCVSSRQHRDTLLQADEIVVRFNDIDKIFDFIEDEEINKKTIIYTIDYNISSDINWEILQMYNEKLENFILKLYDLSLITLVKDCGFKFYWGYPITTFYELQAIAEMGPSYLLLGMPLCFQLERVNTFTSIPIRLLVNDANMDSIPRENGICGFWVRPEDVPVYESYVSVFEFYSTSLREEAGYLKIYAEDRNWPGNLNLLIHNFKVNVDNRGIPEDIGTIRLNCGQRCATGLCHICENAIKFSLAASKKANELRK